MFGLNPCLQHILNMASIKNQWMCYIDCLNLFMRHKSEDLCWRSEAVRWKEPGHLNVLKVRVQTQFVWNPFNDSLWTSVRPKRSTSNMAAEKALPQTNGSLIEKIRPLLRVWNLPADWMFEDSTDSKTSHRNRRFNGATDVGGIPRECQETHGNDKHSCLYVRRTCGVCVIIRVVEDQTAAVCVCVCVSGRHQRAAGGGRPQRRSAFLRGGWRLRYGERRIIAYLQINGCMRLIFCRNATYFISQG